MMRSPIVPVLLSVIVLVAASGALAALPPITCKQGDWGVNCLVDPCRVSSCNPKPTYECVPNYCRLATTYLGNFIPPSPCAAVWIDTTTNKTVACPPPSPPPSPKPLALPPIRCAKGDFGVACLLNPCRVSTCEARPSYVCVPNYCTKATTYLGNFIPASPCSAVWIDTATNMTVPCTPPAAAVSTICPKIYSPVCGTNKKTYSNACLATAAGVKVAFKGLCIFPPTCTKKYVPVCSKSGVTWPSACSAKYNGIKKYTKGPCRKGVCAACLKPGACATSSSPCKGNSKYTCKASRCGSQQVFDNGKRVTVGGCSAVYYSKKTGFPAAACKSP